MERRTLLSLFIAAPLASLMAAACGSDTAEVPAVDESLPPAAAAPGAVLEFGYYGGFTTADIAFQMQPIVYVTTDGRVITPAPVPAIFPGPLVSPSTVRTITPAGIDLLVDAARDAGMLQSVDYESDPLLADASTATLRISVDGDTFVHEAYGLGVGALPGQDGDESAERQAFAAFAEQLNDLAGLVGADQLGPEEAYEPTAYQIISMPAGDLTGFDVEPTIVDWPSSVGVDIATLDECTEVDAALVGDMLSTATQLTFFRDAGEVMQVLARPALPGRTCAGTL